MINDNFCYVPILKWKRAEINALKELYDEHKQYICPLIQIIPKEKAEDDLEVLINRFRDEQLHKIRNDVVDIWGDKKIFISFNLLYTTELKLESIKVVLKDDSKNEGSIVPVIHLSDDKEIKDYVFSFAKENNRELCLRIVPADFGIDNNIDIDKINSNIEDCLKEYEIDESLINLIVDISDFGSDKFLYDKYFKASQEIYNISNWKTFTFSGGSFLKDLSSCKTDIENKPSRIEWLSWKNQVLNNKLTRIPLFSDYTIQFPVYEKMTQFFQSTCSVRYTLEDDWWILKGKKGGFEQYLAHASDLVKHERYYREAFSFGDKYIKEKADHFEEYRKNPEIKGTGSTESWLSAGINHHLTVAATQVSNLIGKR
jgi:hypothetical protein